MYLIIECEELNDQYECDANRTPIAITDDWQMWYKEHRANIGLFEVYEWNGETMTLIKGYSESITAGMALYYWTIDENPDTEYPHIICEWPNLTRSDDIPERARELIDKYLISDDNYDNDTFKDIKTLINTTGSYGWRKENNIALWIVYGEYKDNCFSVGY